MPHLIDKLKETTGQTYDSGITFEIINTDLSKKMLTILINSKDDWGGYGNKRDNMNYLNSRMFEMAKIEPSALGFSSVGFDVAIENGGKDVAFVPFGKSKPTLIKTTINQN